MLKIHISIFILLYRVFWLCVSLCTVKSWVWLSDWKMFSVSDTACIIKSHLRDPLSPSYPQTSKNDNISSLPCLVVSLTHGSHPHWGNMEISLVSCSLLLDNRDPPKSAQVMTATVIYLLLRGSLMWIVVYINHNIQWETEGIHWGDRRSFLQLGYLYTLDFLLASL